MYVIYSFILSKTFQTPVLPGLTSTQNFKVNFECDFPHLVPGDWIGLGITCKDFWKFAIWAIQIIKIFNRHPYGTNSYYFTHFLLFIFFWWYEIKAWIRYSSIQKHRIQIQYVCAESLPRWMKKTIHHKANDWIFSSVVILVRRKTGCSGSTSCICFINFSALVGFQNEASYFTEYDY